MSAEAREAHIFSSLASGSLYSVGQLCDDGCEAYLDKDVCRITKNGLLVLSGTRTPNSRLWIADDKHTAAFNAVFNDAERRKLNTSLSAEPQLSPTHVANDLCPEPHLAARIAFLHATFFSPAISTFCQALDAGLSISLPGKLTAAQVRKHLFFSEATHKGHLDQERQGLRSTKIQPPQPSLQSKELQVLTSDEELLLQADNNPVSIPRRTNSFYLGVREATGKIYTDPTGKFIVPSTKGNNYILVGYDYDSNHIFAEPMKTRGKESQIAATTAMLQKLAACGLKPTFHMLDNEVSQKLLDFLQKEGLTVQLAPAGCHRRNAAERAIRTFKNHFIIGLCTTDDNFPLEKMGRPDRTGRHHPKPSPHQPP